jgi:sulfoxide reductase heme-binding subunit YedZ
MLNRVRQRLPVTPLQLGVYVSAFLPALWLIWDGFNNNLTVNPIQALTQRTGRYALFFLVLSLSCTPLNTLFGWRGLIKVRRPLGLTAFGYALIHFTLFVGVDYQFNLALLEEAILEKPYALVGLAAFIILLSLAITSFKWWMKKLGKNWKRLHRLVYLAGVLVLVHYFWVVKGDLLRLSGDISRPLIYTGIMTVLFALRVPRIKYWKRQWQHKRLLKKQTALVLQQKIVRD